MRQAKRCPVLLALVPILAFLAGASPFPLFGADRGPAAVRSELAAYVDDVFESEPAWGGALVAQDGEVLFEGSYGWSDYGQAKRNYGKTVFRIQSLSKTFTAMSTLMLVERGRLSLEDPVVDYVPELREAEGVTVRHLLQMQSGIPDFITPEALENIDRFHTPEQLLEYFIDLPLIFEPGSQFDYSNSNYVLLGLIIERISDKSYGRFLKRNIFKPLKMKRSVFDADDLSFVGRRAVGYDDVAVDPPTVAEHYPPSMAYAAGGILSTARDLLRWDQALYGEGVISQEMLEQAFTRGVSFYGLGWIIDHVKIQGTRHKLVWHTGGGPGFRSGLVRLVDARVTIVLLFNTTGVEELEDEDVVRWVAKLAKDVGGIVLSGSD
ncbi:MAG: beta-lactamase family protein [Acidobacteriota bacterium]|nr:beta-lactamase family protein [Acidobacteriota bacterium]